MICTVGSLVKGETHRCRWLTATSLYVLACSTTSALLGIFFSVIGQALRQLVGRTSASALLSTIGLFLIGLVALAYAWSDIGMIKMPRPRLMHAVPVTWWRRWQPYGASVAYGAALGLGITTQIQFGAFYVLCLWCIGKGNLVYGAVLMGTYGVTRSLTLFPASWGIYQRCSNSSLAIKKILASQGTAKLLTATLLIIFGAQVLSSILFPV
jgi:hypothetical protein